MDSGSKGEDYFLKLLDHFFDYDVRIQQNLIGISTDNAYNMISTKDAGLYNIMKKAMPNLIHIRDLCHTYNLICEDALKDFPLYIISFIRKICSSFHFGQRASRLEEIQAKAGVRVPLKVLKFIEARWSSLLDSTDRINKLWKYIHIYFKDSDSALKDEVFDPEFELYAYLLNIILHKLVGYITLFQNDNLLWNTVMDKMKESYTVFTGLMLTEAIKEYGFNNAYQIPFEDPSNILFKEKVADLEEFKSRFIEKYPKIMNLLNKIKEVKPQQCARIEREFFSNCRQFILKIVVCIKQRLPFDDELLYNMQVVFLKKAEPKKWKELSKRLPNIIDEDLEITFQSEVDSFEIQYDDIIKDHSNSTISITKRWEILSREYPTMAKLVEALFVVPYSTSPVESTFSEFKAFKTCYRNKMNVWNLEASILAQQEFKLDDIKIYPEMVAKCFNLWKPKPKPKPKPKADFVEQNFINNTAVQNESDVHTQVPISTTTTQNVQVQNLNQSESGFELPRDFITSIEPLVTMMFKQWMGSQDRRGIQDMIPEVSIPPGEGSQGASATSSNKRKIEASLIHEHLKATRLTKDQEPDNQS